MTSAWIRPVIIVSVLVILLLLNAREFKAKRLALEDQFPSASARDEALPFARQQAFQAQTIEQLLHMIHTMLAAILAAVLWK